MIIYLGLALLRDSSGLPVALAGPALVATYLSLLRMGFTSFHYSSPPEAETVHSLCGTFRIRRVVVADPGR